MAGVAIGVRMNGDRTDAHGARGADDATGDLAAVRDQYLAEHRPRFALHRRALAARAFGFRHSGMLPCLRHGFSSFFSRSIASDRQILLRVSRGMMTSSMKPRLPATNGFANFLRYSSLRASIVIASVASLRKMIS